MRASLCASVIVQRVHSSADVFHSLQLFTHMQVLGHNCMDLFEGNDLHCIVTLPLFPLFCLFFFFQLFISEKLTVASIPSLGMYICG